MTKHLCRLCSLKKRFISHGSGDWEVQDHGVGFDSGPSEGFLVCGHLLSVCSRGLSLVCGHRAGGRGSLSSSFYKATNPIMGAPLVAQRVKRPSALRENHVQSLGQQDPLEKEIRQISPVVLPGESHGQRSLVGYSSGGCKESDTTK